MTWIRNIAGLLFLTIAIAGCTSTEKRFEKAVEYEEDGEYQRAAVYYISVLKKDNSWDGARKGLTRVGSIAVDRLLDDANAAEDRGEYDGAIQVLDELEDLRGDALGVGVDLSLPPDYDNYRGKLSQSAITSLIRTGERAEEEKNWEDALETYARVQEKYNLSTDQNEEMVLARARVYTKWAEQDIERGYHRAAYDRAANAVEVLGEDHPRAGGAYDIQDRALEEGTRIVALLPVWLSEEIEDDAPDGLIDEFNDMLDYNYWAEPPAFVVTIDPIELRREVRRLRYDRRLVTRSEAANIGRSLDADYVVVPRARVFHMRETGLKEKTKKTKTNGRNGIDTTWVEQSFTMRIDAEVEYEVINADRKREIASGSVSADNKAKMQRGLYDGDYRDIDLSRKERRLFDEEDYDREIRQLQDDLLEDLAPRLSQEVYDKILREIK